MQEEATQAAHQRGDVNKQLSNQLSGLAALVADQKPAGLNAEGTLVAAQLKTEDIERSPSLGSKLGSSSHPPDSLFTPVVKVYAMAIKQQLDAQSKSKSKPSVAAASMMVVGAALAAAAVVGAVVVRVRRSKQTTSDDEVTEELPAIPNVAVASL